LFFLQTGPGGSPCTLRSLRVVSPLARPRNASVVSYAATPSHHGFQ
jgi:hypothetical protein